MIDPPRIAVGAPVAERAWILPTWLDCLRAQTRPPDTLCFVHSKSSDDTLKLIEGIHDFDWRAKASPLQFYSRQERGDDPADPHRAAHFSKLRNNLRTLFLHTDADIFISLDTDVLLGDETTLERLITTIQDGWDVAAPLLCLHPLGEASHCYNAGWWMAGEQGDPVRVWRRADQNDVAILHPPVRIDIPMAAFAIRRHAMAMSTYKVHERGEDAGFADSLSRMSYRIAWLTDLHATHIWDQYALDKWDGVIV